jgi:murein DD-endopeptidase MepM/ murein hydrolase activator NlpD
MLRSRTLTVALVALAATLALAAAPAADPTRGAAGGELALAVRVIPERPVQGTLFVVEVEARSGELVVGASIADEPLHFRATGEGGFRALAGVPIDAEGSLPLELAVRGADGATDRHRIDVPIARGDYRMERLTVAPRFGRAPDAATAARITREAERAREVSRRSHSTPRMWEGPFVRPRPGRITSGYGNGREFNGQVQSRHMGTDFAGDVGAPVQAAARGVVALVDEFHLGGKVVYLDHGAGLVSGYLHLSRIDVAQGDTVEAGQVIGGVGATGRVTGPHLHWLVRYGLITVDPVSLLELRELSL